MGDTVRRPTKASSPFMAQLLALSAERGLAWAPRYLGQDELLRDVLTFLPGSVPSRWRTFSNPQVCAATRLLREFHEATRGCELAGTHEVVCHNDPGPNNAVFGEADLPYAFIDFDFRGAGAVLEDLGYLAWAWCVSSKPERNS